MMHFEDELKKALRRQDPSPGFAARVAARVAETHRPRWRMVPHWRAAWAAGIAAMVAVGLFVNAEYRQRRAEQAGREAVQALRIAAEKLNFARGKVLDLQPRAAEPEN